MGHSRKGLCLVFEQIVDRMLARRKEAELGIMSLFGDPVAVDGADAGGATEPGFDDARIPIPADEFDKMQKLAFEKEMLGLYVSDHPLMGAEAALRKHTESTIAELRDLREGEVRWVGGVVTALSRRYTKKGDLMGTFTLEDLESAIEVWMFPRVMQEYGHLLGDDAIVCVKGRVDLRDDMPKLTCLELKRPELVLDGGPPLTVKLPDNCPATMIDSFKRVLVGHPGDSPVFVRTGKTTLRLAAEFNVDSRNGLCAELRELLGAECLLA
jgi:DNA polymerase-3 subunit alpha